VTLVTVHPFGLSGAGGGPRIMRALLTDPPEPVLSVATGVHVPPTAPAGLRERHLPMRPHLGRIESSRFSQVGSGLELALARAATRRLTEVVQRAGATRVHAVSHGPEFWPAMQAARRVGVPFALTVHDDLRYLLREAPLKELAYKRLGIAWREAETRFVISEAIGREYSARYGERLYTIVTDGLREEDVHAPRGGDGLRVYFAGLFHRGYAGNLRRFAMALDLLAGRREDVRLSMRCGSLPERPSVRFPLEVLEFGPESVVQEDLKSADLLYLPLMFGEEYRDMVDFSLSTKLVTYLGSGIPILYHGPRRGAAYELLAANDAAVLATSEDPAELARTIEEEAARAPRLVANALALARSSFMLTEQRRRFWDGIRSA
jgi:hypothetical protein